MNKEKRFHQGYEIIEECMIGNRRIVIGHNPKAPNPYVCWYCKNREDYFWGYYCNTLDAARKKLEERYQENREKSGCDEVAFQRPREWDSHER